MFFSGSYDFFLVLKTIPFGIPLFGIKEKASSFGHEALTWFTDGFFTGFLKEGIRLSLVSHKMIGNLCNLKNQYMVLRKIFLDYSS